jgi:hypothetical protein
VRRETYENIGEVSEYNIDFVTIVSQGNVYTQDILVEGQDGYKDEVRLFILKGNLDNGSEVDAIIGILYEEYAKLTNDWLYSYLVNKGIEIMEIDGTFFERENLEDLFKKGSILEYAYYSNQQLNVPREYIDVLNVVLEGSDCSDITDDLLNRGYTEKLLMPYVILEYSAET